MLLFGKILVEGVGRMDWIVLFGGIFASVLEDDLGAPRVFYVVSLELP